MDQEKTNSDVNVDDLLKKKTEKFMNMGLGKLANQSIVFPRAFRWTLHPVNHDDVRWWFQKLKVDYKNKVMEVHVFDDVNGEVSEWLEDIGRDEGSRKAQLRHYDGCGNLLYTVDFVGMEVVENFVEYDYSSSEVITHKLKISFRRAKRTNKLNIS